MQKDFEKWNQLKQKIDSTNKQIIYKDRDVWWCISASILGMKKMEKMIFLRDQF